MTDEQVGKLLTEAQALIDGRLGPALVKGEPFSPDGAVIALTMMAAQIMLFRGAPLEAAVNNAAMLVRMQYAGRGVKNEIP